MRNRLAALVLVSVLPWCVACGGKSSENDERSSGGGGAGGEAGKPSGGKAAGGTSTEPDCDGYADDDGTFVGISITNASTETLFLGQEMVTCGVSPLFEVRDAAGGSLQPLGPCRNSCELAMSSGNVSCPPLCAFPAAIRLEPGESMTTSWDGRYSKLLGLPKECQSKSFPSPECDRAIAVEPGTFAFAARAGTKQDCSQAGGDCGTCTPDPEGGCTTQGALIAGAIREAEAEVALDASYGVGRGSGDGALNFVEIRFEGP